MGENASTGRFPSFPNHDLAQYISAAFDFVRFSVHQKRRKGTPKQRALLAIAMNPHFAEWILVKAMGRRK